MGIVLIGPPAVGKSTVGRLLAAELGWVFVDTDERLEHSADMGLQSIVERGGRDELLARENRLLQNLNCHRSVVATGGSAVYHTEAMQALSLQAAIVLLSIDYSTLAKRMPNYENRGIARAPGQSLRSLFTERAPLYRRYAQYSIDCSEAAGTAEPDELVRQIKGLFELP